MLLPATLLLPFLISSEALVQPRLHLSSPKNFNSLGHKKVHPCFHIGKETRLQATVSTDMSPELLEEFLDVKNRREALMGASIFQNLDRLDIEVLTQALERVELDNGTVLFKQGDKSDALYFVVDGSLECYEEASGEIKALLGAGDLFGELGLLNNEPRALSVRATPAAASLWKLTKPNLAKVMSSGAMKEASDNLEEYEEYFELRQRRKKLRSCPIFKKLQLYEVDAMALTMEEFVFSENELVFSKGDAGDSMFFVTEGEFDCFDPSNDKVLKVCTSGDYFGELGLFFDSGRRLSVRAATSGKVLKLSRQSFFASLQESAVDEQALELLQGAYKDQEFGEVVDEIYQYLVVKSLPKKKPVSFHSTFSSITFGVLVATFAARFHPGFYSMGIPAIFPVAGRFPPELALQFLMTMTLLSATGVLGLFRFPPRTPRLRQRMFEASVATCVYLTDIGISSVDGLPDGFWWFDAFSLPGRLVLTAGVLWFAITNIRLVDEVIAGSGRGKETVSGFDTTAGAAFNTGLLWLVSYTFIAVYPVVMISDYPSYSENVSRVFYENEFESFFLVATLSATTVSAMGSLITTLQFEKKITPPVGAALALFLQFSLNMDAVGSAIEVILQPGKLNQVNEYMLPMIEDSHIVPVYTAFGALAVLNALRKKISGVTNDDLDRKKV